MWMQTQLKSLPPGEIHTHTFSPTMLPTDLGGNPDQKQQDAGENLNARNTESDIRSTDSLCNKKLNARSTESDLHSTDLFCNTIERS